MKRIVTLAFLISMLLTGCGEASTSSSAPQDVYQQDLPSPTELPTESPITNDGVPVFEDRAVSPEPAVVSCEEGSHTGTVKWFNSTKGYGFITSDEGNDVYVHYSAILVDGYPTLEEGQMVKFCLEDGPNGPQAVHVEVLNP